MGLHYICRIVSNAGKHFDGIEEAVASVSLQSLSDIDCDITYKYRRLAELLVRNGGLTLSNSITNAKEYFSLCTL